MTGFVTCDFGLGFGLVICYCQMWHEIFSDPDTNIIDL